MRGYLVSPEANSDIFAIWRWIAKDSVELADRVDTELHEVFEALARMPRLGRRREDLTPRPVLFMAVLRGTRDVKRILKKR